MALFYIYRNLHRKDTFSIRLRGRVIDRLVSFEACDVSFKVNESSRLRVLSEGHKNVHAFVITDFYGPSNLSSNGLEKVWYNPKKSSTFMLGGTAILRAKRVLFTGGQCYLLEKHEEPTQDIRTK